ncbi:polysaccharide pyruvyl transferase family protein [Roseicyclus persicicus]|nr:polysaccharide pyruvyl transferase family protein [Roseibacterium persicicum]
MVEGMPALPMGDPGILVSEIWPAASAEKAYSVGLVPHQSQVGDPLWKALNEATPASILIDLTNPDINRTFDLFSKCEMIVSTSLHGLIFADAYGIPNVWAAYRDIHPAEAFKFYDYFSSIRRRQFRRLEILHCNRNLTAISPELIDTSHFARVGEYKNRIAAAFPSHLKA